MKISMKKVVVFTGAGISAESGIKTFRDAGGLWETHKIEDVATPEAWERNAELVLRFYNERRKQIRESKPNKAHLALVELEENYHVQIITQNVDDLHERAGSKNVMHLHGEILKARSSVDPGLITHLKDKDLNIGDKCAKGSQLRPHIVWFGEMVPMMELASIKAEEADILIVVGTSLNVYPAANIIDYAPLSCKAYYVDTNPANVTANRKFNIIKNTAVGGVPELVKKLLSSND